MKILLQSKTVEKFLIANLRLKINWYQVVILDFSSALLSDAQTRLNYFYSFYMTLNFNSLNNTTTIIYTKLSGTKAQILMLIK